MDKASKAGMRPTGLAMRTTSRELFSKLEARWGHADTCDPKPMTLAILGSSKLALMN
jgi:hypothetical protein